MARQQEDGLRRRLDRIEQVDAGQQADIEPKLVRELRKLEAEQQLVVIIELEDRLELVADEALLILEHDERS